MNTAMLKIYAMVPFTFVWQNVPSFKETVIFSGIQAFIEIIGDLDKTFGSNPTAKAIIRDVAKVPGEVSLASTHQHYGSTPFWYDSVSLTSAIQKPLLKGGTIGLYNYHFTSGIQENIHGFEESLQGYVRLHTTQSLVITNKTRSLLKAHMSDGIIEKASRFSNIIGEPIARVINGCAKERQTVLLKQFLASPAANGLKTYAAIRKDATVLAAFSNFKNQNEMRVWQVPGYVVRNGLSKVPYAGTNALLKSTMIDMLGKLPVWKYVKDNFVKAREYLDLQVLSSLEGITDVKKQSFYARAGKIWGVDFYAERSSNSTSTFQKFWEQDDFLRKSGSTAATFALEFLEKTAFNMVVMTGLATPNQALGNALFRLDGMAPNVFRPVGVLLGAYYIKAEFFDHSEGSKATGIVASKTATPQEKCYISFFNKVLEENGGDLPTTYKPTDANGEKIIELLSCLGQLEPSETIENLS